jgi:type IV pilus assembly protein PilV
MLLEALIAILIFSLGILTVIGIQATSIKMAADAQLRTRAALLADRLVGEMWAGGGDIASLGENFKTDGPLYDKWLKDVEDFAVSGLPGVVRDGDTKPTAVITPGGVIAGTPRNAEVTITLFWRTPSMSADDPAHRYVVTSIISRNP